MTTIYIIYSPARFGRFFESYRHPALASKWLGTGLKSGYFCGAVASAAQKPVQPPHIPLPWQEVRESLGLFCWRCLLVKNCQYRPISLMAAFCPKVFANSDRIYSTKSKLWVCCRPSSPSHPTWAASVALKTAGLNSRSHMNIAIFQKNGGSWQIIVIKLES